MTPIDIRCLLVGGTIDSRYHQRLGKMVIAHNVEKIIKGFRLPHHRFHIERLMKMDSRDMIAEHRSQILVAIQKSKENKILITHGTDTMCETGNYLLKHLSSREKKAVVITGAMLPYGSMGGIPLSMKGDAEANVISAISMLDVLSTGVWIVFHGRKINPSKAFKDYSRLTISER